MILEKHYFLRKQCIFNNCINQMLPVPKEIFSQLSLFNVNFYLKSCIFFLHFILYLCVYPDPYSEYRSRSRKLLNTDPIPVRIRIQIWIHNTDTKFKWKKNLNFLVFCDFHSLKLEKYLHLYIKFKKGKNPNFI